MAGRRGHALVLHAMPEVLEILKDHLFNWRIWPDFSRIPSADSPFLRYAPLEIGVPRCLGNREITAIPANHTVPAVGYLLRGAGGSLLFSGDTDMIPAIKLGRREGLQVFVVKLNSWPLKHDLIEDSDGVRVLTPAS